ncbi:EF-hand domain-containing protein [Crateriforma conspicua]|uniref:EF hand n=1 Tax=Crateriforma conspicua TaxID=2527996 RepID=A0A5C5Y766_9PLAN|nr:EF-hand domain-containing protein [Crateriforma conspicua]TWT70778.1 EF hand [Crateriforma conspicua]
MKFTLPIVMASALAVLVTSAIQAQPPGGRGQGGPGFGGQGFGGPGRGGPDFGGPGGPPPNAIAEALDTDGDHVISGAEIQKASDALKKLDRNGDGRLSNDEFDPMHQRYAGGPEGRGGEGRGGRGADGRGDGGGFVSRIMSFDENGDGKVSKDELPARMQMALDRYDANKDGVLDKDELDKASAGAGPGNRGGRGPGPGGPGAGGPGGERGGPPSPDQFVREAMEFDADGDGKLDAGELAKAAEQLMRRGPGGQGPGGEGGPGGPRGQGGRAGGRPQRPN